MPETPSTSAGETTPRPFSAMPRIGVGPGYRSHNTELRTARLPFCERAARE